MVLAKVLYIFIPIVNIIILKKHFDIVRCKVKLRKECIKALIWNMKSKLIFPTLKAIKKCNKSG